MFVNFQREISNRIDIKHGCFGKFWMLPMLMHDGSCCEDHLIYPSRIIPAQQIVYLVHHKHSITGIMEVNQSSMLNPWYLLHVMLGQENNPRGTKPFMLS
ncbi:hypothetical protein VPH35_107645 [Triticum aestivum]|uniref:Uncharacterized protein n=1 Tax=Triticum aestivum TaxID=4565 RepID=A0A3B6PCQ8_WHEAT